MFSLALLFFSYSVADFFLINILREIGGDTGDLGSITAFKAMLEIPVMLFYSQITSRFRCSTVMRISALAFIGKALMMAMAGSVGMLYGANLLQTLSFALMIPAMVQYVNLVIDTKDSAKGQAIANGMMTLGSIFASLIGGWLYDALSVHATLLISVAIAAGGMLLCNVTIEKNGHESLLNEKNAVVWPQRFFCYFSFFISLSLGSTSWELASTMPAMRKKLSSRISVGARLSLQAVKMTTSNMP